MASFGTKSLKDILKCFFFSATANSIPVSTRLLKQKRSWTYYLKYLSNMICLAFPLKIPLLLFAKGSKTGISSPVDPQDY